MPKDNEEVNQSTIGQLRRLMGGGISTTLEKIARLRDSLNQQIVCATKKSSDDGYGAIELSQHKKWARELESEMSTSKDILGYGSPLYYLERIRVLLEPSTAKMEKDLANNPTARLESALYAVGEASGELQEAMDASYNQGKDLSTLRKILTLLNGNPRTQGDKGLRGVIENSLRKAKGESATSSIG